MLILFNNVHGGLDIKLIILDIVVSICLRKLVAHIKATSITRKTLGSNCEGIMRQEHHYVSGREHSFSLPLCGQLATRFSVLIICEATLQRSGGLSKCLMTRMRRSKRTVRF